MGGEGAGRILEEPFLDSIELSVMQANYPNLKKRWAAVDTLP